MRTVDLILRKRGGDELSVDEIQYLVNGYTSGDIPDYQMSAFLMATFFSGMTDRELSALTEAMMATGEILTLHDIPGIKVDKHSTGGVGDKTSLICAPIAAAAGVIVPMISGRGLGHTGGTLDKLEAIPGFRTDLTVEQFRAQLTELGFASLARARRSQPPTSVFTLCATSPGQWNRFHSSRPPSCARRWPRVSTLWCWT